MGQCQSRPTNETDQVVDLSSEINPQKRQSMRLSTKDSPSSDFATPVNEVPKLSKQVEARLSQLGPFNYEECGEYKHDTQLGPFRLKNGAVYVGQWKNGKMDGKGKYYLPDHSLFEGVSVQNQIEGFGRIIHANGDYFEGQVKRSKANGQGTYVEGDIMYRGSFKENLQHGEGIESSNLYEFRGNYKLGQKQKGTFVLKNKQKYEYIGQFKQNKYHGRGVLINDVGKYEGQFSKGLKHGYGRFTWADGSYFEGEYINDQKHGDGKLYSKKGILIKECYWQHNNIAN